MASIFEDPGTPELRQKRSEYDEWVAQGRNEANLSFEDWLQRDVDAAEILTFYGPGGEPKKSLAEFEDYTKYTKAYEDARSLDSGDPVAAIEAREQANQARQQQLAAMMQMRSQAAGADSIADLESRQQFDALQSQAGGAFGAAAGRPMLARQVAMQLAAGGRGVAAGATSAMAKEAMQRKVLQAQAAAGVRGGDVKGLGAEMDWRQKDHLWSQLRERQAQQYLQQAMRHRGAIQNAKKNVYTPQQTSNPMDVYNAVGGAVGAGLGLLGTMGGDKKPPPGLDDDAMADKMGNWFG